MMNSNAFGVNNLVLLIGTNPLPNFIAASYLIRKNPKLIRIIFIHSEQTKFQQSTKEYALNIAALLQKKHFNEVNKINFLFLPLNNVDDARVIRNDISQLEDLFEPGSCVHLNYTGGTKVMVVHIHAELNSIEGVEKEFSYLSPKIFCLIDDNGNRLSDDLRAEIPLTFEQITSLHGFERKNDDRNFNFNSALEVFKKLIGERRLNEFCSSEGGYNRKYFQDDNGNLILNPEKNAEKLETLTISGVFLEMNNKLPEECRIFGENGKLSDPLPSKRNSKKSLKFFDGDWLEQYTFELLISEFQTIPNIQIYHNWVIKKPMWENNLDFELDVILIRGYQLFGISCTTDTKKSLCKSKGFEIILRTEQIGGDESRAILVTLAEDNTVSELQEELSIETGSKKNILVLGKNDLRKDYLLKKFKQFMGD